MLQYKDFLDEEIIQFLGEEYAHLVGELPYNKKKGFDPYEMAAIIGIDIVYGNEQKYQNDGKITIDKNTNIKTNLEHKHEVFVQFLKAVDYRKNKLGEI